MTVTKTTESIPVADAIQSFMIAMHQNGASPSEILRGVLLGFNSHDGIITNNMSGNDAGLKELAKTVEIDIQSVLSKIREFGV